MNEELRKALEEFAQKGLELVNAGADQIPGILQDIVGAAILSATIWWWGALVALLIFLAMFVVSVISGDDDLVGVGIFGFFGIVISGLVLMFNWYSYYYAVKFPRLVILDYLRGLL